MHKQGFVLVNDYGENTYILKTTNQGTNWVVIFSLNSTTNSLFTLYFVNENTGYKKKAIQQTA